MDRELWSWPGLSRRLTPADLSEIPSHRMRKEGRRLGTLPTGKNKMRLEVEQIPKEETSFAQLLLRSFADNEPATINHEPKELKKEFKPFNPPFTKGFPDCRRAGLSIFVISVLQV